MIRRVGQPRVEEGRFIQFNNRQGYNSADGDAVHFQARGQRVNRDYGAAGEVPYSNEFGAFLGGLRQSGALPIAPSLAGTGREYNRLEVRDSDDGFIFSAEFSGTPPIFAYPFVSNGRIEFEVDADDLPEELVDALS